MKYSEAWSKIVSENAVMKTMILVSCGLSVFFGLSLLRLSLKEPLVIERGCSSVVAKVGSSKRTDGEIQAFLRDALAQRFDSGVLAQDLISQEEAFSRSKERKEMESRKIAQKVVFNSASVTDAGTQVDADRLISVGEIRSAFRFPLKVRLASVARSIANPYGLILEEVKNIGKGEK